MPNVNYKTADPPKRHLWGDAFLDITLLLFLKNNHAKLRDNKRSINNNPRNIKLADQMAQKQTRQLTIADLILRRTMHRLAPQAYSRCQSVAPPGESRWVTHYVAGFNSASVFALLCENITSSTKWKARNILHCCHGRTKPRPQIMYTKFIGLDMWFLTHASGQTDIQKRRLQYFTPLPGAK